MLKGYAIEQAGRILMRTVRETEGESKSAAVHDLKKQGARWEALAKQFGWCVIRVGVTRIDDARPSPARPSPPPRSPARPRARAAPRPAPPPAPRPEPRPAVLAGGLSRLGDADVRAIRLARRRG